MKQQIDGCFVIHQDINLEKVADLAKTNSCSSLLVVSSHYLFSHERQVLALHKFNSIKYFTFAELLTDEEAANCDNYATEELLPSTRNYRRAWTYSVDHMALSRAYKNSLICQKISNRFQVRKTWCANGLGIDATRWAQLTPSMLETQHGLTHVARKHAARLAKSILFRFFPRRTHTFVDKDNLITFIGSIQRMDLSKKPTVSKLRWRVPSTHIIAATIHEYGKTRISANRDVEIYIDGHQPANYSRSYLDGYQGGKITFVPRDMYDNKWFLKYGRITRKPRTFHAVQKMQPPRLRKSRVQHICIALNHAGDWSALINRSDTDELIESCSRMAKLFPSLKFIIRPHPTMATEEHEGTNSIIRIHKFVDLVELPNFSVSSRSLDQDLDNADLVISEYSDVLIKAIRMGIPSIIVNLTGRRNFMQDYSRIGIRTARSDREFESRLLDWLKHPHKELQNQLLATEAYNNEYQKYLSGD